MLSLKCSIAFLRSPTFQQSPALIGVRESAWSGLRERAASMVWPGLGFSSSFTRAMARRLLQPTCSGSNMQAAFRSVQRVLPPSHGRRRFRLPCRDSPRPPGRDARLQSPWMLHRTAAGRKARRRRAGASGIQRQAIASRPRSPRRRAAPVRQAQCQGGVDTLAVTISRSIFLPRMLISMNISA